MELILIIMLLRLFFHKTLKDYFYISNNFDGSYNMCVAIYFVWVLVCISDPHTQFMLPNSIRLFEAPLQHLNLIQNLSQKVVTVGCMAFFLSLLFLSISSLEQADLVNLLCYLICHVRDLFLKFFICTDYIIQPSSIFFLHLVQPFAFSSLFLSYC